MKKKNELTAQEEEILKKFKAPQGWTTPKYAIGDVIQVPNDEANMRLALVVNVNKNKTWDYEVKYLKVANDITEFYEEHEIIKKVPALKLTVYNSNNLDKAQTIYFASLKDKGSLDEVSNTFYAWLKSHDSLATALGDKVHYSIEALNMADTKAVHNNTELVSAIMHAFTILYFMKDVNVSSPFEVELREFKSSKQAYKYYCKSKR